MVMCPTAPAGHRSDILPDDTAEAPTSLSTMRDLLDSLDTPQGFKTELVNGEIIVTPPAQGDHEVAIGTVNRQIAKKSHSDEFIATGNRGLAMRGENFIPDLTIGPESVFAGSDLWGSPDGTELVVEVTSPTSLHRDRVVKRLAYASAMIPLYLLVDRQDKTVTLFSEPDGADYRVSRRASFGENLPLPEPFGFELDTSSFK